MVNDAKGGLLAKQTQIEKYGGIKGYKAEMQRRASMRKTIGNQGAFSDPDFAKKAANKRWEKERAKKDSSTEG